MKVADIAKVCYEVNNAYRSAVGEMTKVGWDKLGKEAKAALIKGIEESLKEPKSAEQQHNTWLENMLAEGWKYAEKLNEKEKEHPQMVPFLGLPLEQRVKDSIFTAIIAAMGKIVVPDGEVKLVEVGKLPVKYIGVRPEYTDGTYQTGLTFKKDETIMVPEDAALKMLTHKDVYVKGEVPAEYEPEEPKEQEKKDEGDENSDEAVQAAKDAINIMNRKQAIIDFAEVNFSGVKLSDRDTLATLKQKVTGFIDQYGLN